MIGNKIFIGYTRIDYHETGTNKTNIIFKFTLKNVDNENGPDFDQENDKGYFIFPESTIKTNSIRQISCEPLKIMNFDSSINNGSDYRLLCIHEALDFNEDQGVFQFQVYSSFINEEFNGFEGKMRAYSLDSSDDDNLSFKLFRINDTYARCVMKKAVYDIYLNLKIEGDTTILEPKYIKPKNLNIFSSNLDLFDYNNNLIFCSEKVSTVNEENIYYFGIYYENSPNYFKLFDNNENNVISIQGYYNETQSQNNILFIYKTPTYIKYFTLTYQSSILNLIPFTIEFHVLSDEEISYDFNQKTEIANIDNIQIESLTLNDSGIIETYRYPINIDNSLMIENNLLTSLPSLNIWFTYTFAFIDINFDYDKIYYLGDSKIEILTCYKNSCTSCTTNFNQCDGECQNENQAPLIDSPDNCYNIDNLVKGYKYNPNNNMFEKCYPNLLEKAYD